MRSSTFRGIAVVVGLTAGLSGCTGLEPAAIGAVATGVQAGASVVNNGVIEGVYLADGQRTADAVRATLHKAGYTITRDERVSLYRWVFTAEDDRFSAVQVSVEELTENLTEYEVSIGWFRSDALAQLLHQQIQQHLEAARAGDLGQADAELQVEPEPEVMGDEQAVDAPAE
jgi:hypothetical protein